MDIKENLKKILIFCFMVLAGISAYLFTKVLWGNEDLFTILMVILGLIAFIPYVLLQTILFTYVDRLEVGKTAKRLIFTIFGGFETSLVLVLILFVKFGGFNFNLTLFISGFALVVHFLVSIALPWRDQTWV